MRTPLNCGYAFHYKLHKPPGETHPHHHCFQQRPFISIIGFAHVSLHRRKTINTTSFVHEIMLRGTRGYLAPEWLGSKITEKVDIYSFGIVLVEIICGRRNLDESQPEERVHLISLLQEKARCGKLFDLVDTSSNDMQFHREEVREMMELAMWCLQVDSSKRPLMSTVAKVLEGAMTLEATPHYDLVASYELNRSDVGMQNYSYLPSATHLSGPR